MRLLILVSALLVSMAANANCNQGFGPGGCVPESPALLGPAELCIIDCKPVQYTQFGLFALATSTLANGYTVLGWAGPCQLDNLSLCPDIYNQAFQDLYITAQRANRAQYHIAP